MAVAAILDTENVKVKKVKFLIYIVDRKATIGK